MFFLILKTINLIKRKQLFNYNKKKKNKLNTNILVII